jgi:hypothetical protein
MSTKAGRPVDLPKGFEYRQDFLSPEEEQDLLTKVAGLDFQPFEFQGYIAMSTTSVRGGQVQPRQFRNSLIQLGCERQNGQLYGQTKLLKQ